MGGGEGEGCKKLPHPNPPPKWGRELKAKLPSFDWERIKIQGRIL